MNMHLCNLGFFAQSDEKVYSRSCTERGRSPRQTRLLPLLLVFFDDMRVGEIQIDGGGGQPAVPEDFLNRSQ